MCKHLLRILALISLLQLTAMFNGTEIWWRPIPGFPACTIEGTTETPSPVLVESIAVLEDPPFSLVNLGDSQYEVSFGVDWDPPAERYGAGNYEVYVGSEPIREENNTGFVATTGVRF